MQKIFVLNVPDFQPFAEAAKEVEGAVVKGPVDDYYVIESDGELEFNRKTMGLTPAIWNGILTGGMTGRIKEFTHTVLRVAPV